MTPPSALHNAESVLYFFKQLESRTSLECRVSPMPLHEFHRVTYNFALSLKHDNDVETEVIGDVTCSIREAEAIFDLICRNNVRPCHLSDVISDSIGVLLYDSAADYGIAGIQYH